MKAGKVVRKQEKDVQKTMLTLKIFSAKTNIFVNKLNGKIGAESVALQFGNRKRMFKINVNSENILPKTNIFVHKLNGKIGVENPLNFTYT